MEGNGSGIGRAMTSDGELLTGSCRGSGLSAAGSDAGGGGVADDGSGAWMLLPQEGQGPVTPANSRGTESLMPHDEQKKVIGSFAIAWMRLWAAAVGVNL